jgi:hypothetical protein
MSNNLLKRALLTLQPSQSKHLQVHHDQGPSMPATQAPFTGAHSANYWATDHIVHHDMTSPFLQTETQHTATAFDDAQMPMMAYGAHPQFLGQYSSAFATQDQDQSYMMSHGAVQQHGGWAANHPPPPPPPPVPPPPTAHFTSHGHPPTPPHSASGLGGRHPYHHPGS